MSNYTDWLDEILSIENLFGYKGYADVNGMFIQTIDGTERVKQQILTHISKNFVTKEECEKRVLEARIAGMQWYLNPLNRAGSVIAFDELSYLENKIKELSK